MDKPTPIARSRPQPVVVAQALATLRRRLRSSGAALNDPTTVRNFLSLRIGAKKSEVFTVLFLDAQNRLITAEDMFRGTLTQTAVYPREIVKRGLEVNAASVIVAHNHPSGNPEASQADLVVTNALAISLRLVEIRLLDHFIVAAGDAISLASLGISMDGDACFAQEPPARKKVGKAKGKNATVNGYRDWVTMNAAEEAIINAAGILAAAGLAKSGVNWQDAVTEAALLLRDARDAVAPGQQDFTDLEKYLNRALSICESVIAAGNDIGQINKAQALRAAENILNYVCTAYLGGSVPKSNFAMLRDPSRFLEQGNQLQAPKKPKSSRDRHG